MKTDHSSFENEWGHGRMVLVPFRNREGQPFCFGASMSVEDLSAAQTSWLVRTVALGSGAAGLGLLGALALARLVTKPVTRLTSAAEEISHGDLGEPVHVDGPLEIENLGRALDGMRLAIGENINALRTSESEQRRLLHNLSAGVVIHDAEGRISYANPVAAQLLAVEGEQLAGRTVTDGHWTFLDDDGAPIPNAHFPVAQVFAKGTAVTDQVVGIQAGEKVETTWVVLNAFPEVEPDDSIRRVVATLVDVTPLKRLEKQLVQAQKMEAVGQLAGGVAHDFNNILQAIGGYTELAMADLDSESKPRKLMDEVAKASERAGRLVDQLLAFSRRQILEPGYLDLNEVTKGILDMLKRLIGEHIQLDFIPGHHLGTVHADQTMMEQVLINLCVNARDAMPEGGRLIIETENVRFDREYCTRNLWARPGRYVLVSVTDTGCGMDAATVDRIFEPFFTTKGAGAGTGLGLSTVYGVVRQHEGMARVYSEVDKGTTFKIYLPAVERPAQAVGSKISAPPPGGDETILVAEDDRSLAELAKQTLERAGYRVLAATDGRSAVEIFRENAAEVRLLLLDVVMPGLGGVQVYEKILSEHGPVPALFASGYSQNAIHRNFVLQEGMRLIRKPYHGTELLRRVRDILDEDREEKAHNQE
jgi:signal transduction histidine kinase/ActR/RegA family two-component response regulator/HAMP domain-containing protein